MKKTHNMIFNQYFYHPDLTQPVVTLSQEESEHCVRALRHRAGDEVLLTDGLGNEAHAIILTDNPKACQVEVHNVRMVKDTSLHRLHLAIAPTKNIDRIEWLVEKCVELGIESIHFILCDNSERPRVNMDRMRRIAVSALKQCQTTWLPPMELVSYREFLESHAQMPADKYIAWCDDENTRQLARENFSHENVILLIGPEGDFSAAEIETARQHGYTEVKLGNRRLRTETAGLYGCLLMAVKDI